eukprot:5464691-Amphidinium_carterae.1
MVVRRLLLLEQVPHSTGCSGDSTCRAKPPRSHVCGLCLGPHKYSKPKDRGRVEVILTNWLFPGCKGEPRDQATGEFVEGILPRQHVVLDLVASVLERAAGRCRSV